MGRIERIKNKVNKLRAKKTYKVTTIISIFDNTTSVELRIEAVNKKEAENIAQMHIAGNIKMSTDKINQIK